MSSTERRLRLGRKARLAFLLAVVAAMATLGGSSASAAGPSITVTPSSGLTPGQQVTIDGTGFTANATVPIDQCRTYPPNNFCNNITSVTADSNGDFSYQTNAVYLFSDGTPCFNGLCRFRATDPPSNSTFADISFTPGVPILGVTVSDSPDPVSVGNQVTYTVTVANSSGSAAASGVKLYASPRNSNNGSLPIDSFTGGTCSAASFGGGDVCAIGSLPANGTATLTFKVTAPGPAGQPISLDATTWGNEVEPTPADNEDFESTSEVVAATPNLSVALDDANLVAGAAAGNVTAHVSNSGTGASNAGTITFTLPAGGKLGYGSGACATPSGLTLTCNLPAIGPGGSTTISAPVMASHDALGDYSVGAAVADPSEAAADQGNNTASGTVHVTAQSDETVSLADGSLVAGGASTNLAASVSNAGPSDSGSVNVTYTLPASGDLVFGSGLPANGCAAPSGNQVTCTIANVVANGSASTGNVPVKAIASALGNETVQVAVSAATEPAGAQGNDGGSNTVTVTGQADLSSTIANTPNTGIVAGQDSFTSTSTITNSGPSDSHGYSVTYSIAGGSGLSFDASQPTGCAPNGAALVCGTNPNITPGNSTALPAVKVDVAAGALGTYTVSSHVATTTSGVTDPTLGNNDGSDTAQVVSHADLSVTADGPGAAEIAGASGGFDYTLLVANGGPSDNHSDGSGNGYTAFMPLEPGITFSTTGSTAGCAATTGGVNCSGSGLAAGDSKSFTLHVTAAPDIVPAASQVTGTDLSDTATVTLATVTGASDPNTINNHDAASVHIDARADLALGVSTTHAAGVTPPYVAGDSTNGAFSYVYTVTDNGPSTHKGDFTVTDTLPAGFVFQSGAGCGAVGQVVTCTDSSVLDPTSPSGKSHVFTVAVKVDHTVADGSYSDNAQVATGAAATPEPTGAPNNNSANTSVSVITKADLVITGTGDGASRSPALIFANGTASQNTVTFTVTFHNGGPSDARHSTLKFNSLSSHLGSADWCLVTNTVACGPTDTFTTYNATTGIDVGTLAPGDSATVVLHAHALSSDRNGPFNVAQGFAVSLPLPTTDDTSGNNTAAAPSVEIDTVSSPPQNVQAVPGNGNAIVTWQEPSNLGGPTRTIIDYSVTATPSVGSGFTVSAGAPKVACPNLTTNNCYQLNVSGLAVTKPATTYVFAVTARNQVGSSDSASASAKPSANAAAALVPAAGSTLSTCTVATTAQPVCVSFTVPGGGTGGVFGTLGGFPDVILPGGFCGAGATCNTPSASSGIGPLGAYLNRKSPIKETILWDSSTIPPSARNANSCGANKTIITCFPNNVTFYDESSTALAANQPSEPMNAPGHIHFCADSPQKGGAGNVNWARSTPYTDSAGSACIQSMTVQTGQPGRDAQKGDVKVVLLFTSDSDIIQGHR